MELLTRVQVLPVELRFVIAAFVLSLGSAAEHGLLPVVQLLLEQTTIKHRAVAALDQAIVKAAKSGNLRVVQYLHQCKGGVALVYAFEVAAANGHLQVVQYLHKYLPSDSRRTRAIDGSAANGHLPVVRFLLEAAKDSFSVAAIDRAAEGGHEAVIDFLLQHEAKAVGVRESHGRAFTTLGIRWAQRNNHKNIARRLQDLIQQGRLR